MDTFVKRKFKKKIVCLIVHGKRNIIHELYNTLVKLRYPEIAQTSFEEFADTILVGSKRIDLLYWILQKSSTFNNEPSSKSRDQALGDKVFKYYTQIGLCNDENIFLGKCEIDKQLEFLSLLILFIKNIYTTDIASPKNDENINNMNVLEVANKTEDHSNLPFNITCRNSIEVDSNKIKSLESLKDFKHEQFIDTYALDKLCSNIKKNQDDINEEKIEIWKPVLQEFNSSFKSIVSMPLENINYDISDSDKNLCTDIQNVYSTFSVVNKVLLNESQIKNRLVPDKSVKKISYLQEALQNTLVLIEQACNMSSDNNLQN